MASQFLKRDPDGWDDDDYYWGYSPTATIVKWTIVAVILFLIVLWLVGGYYHAQRRMKNGLPPLAYHRFLVSRHQRARFEPQPAFSFYNQHGYAQEYPMNTYPPPPPPYNPQQNPPPMYQPPEGGSKVNPEQQFSAPTPGAAPGPSNGAEASSAMHTVHLNQAPPAPENYEAQLPPRQPKASFFARFNPLKRGS